MAALDDPEKSTFREYWEALLIAMILFVNFTRVFVFQPFKIPSGSMEDNLLVGDHVFVNKFVFGPHQGAFSSLLPQRPIRRGDIIVFRWPKNLELDYVKRVIGLPGDTVLIRRKDVFVNGQKLDEPYAIHIDRKIFPGGDFQPEPYRSRDNFGPLTVPQGEYFVMGDNRDNSEDSRFWGTVPDANVKGQAFLVYWSFDLKDRPQPSTAAEQLTAVAVVILHFFDWTRWNRTFFVIDSRYHYTPDVAAYGHD